MIRLSVIDHAPSEWATAVSELLLRLQRHFGISSDRAATIGEVAADAYLWIGTDVAQLARAIETAPPVTLSRTIVMGPTLGYAFGKPRSPHGTVAELLERYGLAGAFGGTALLDWQGAPSFAGPKALMERFATNAVKAFQSEHYANWFGPRESSLAEFLAAFLGAILLTDGAASPAAYSESELEAELREAPTPLAGIDDEGHWFRLGSVRISKRAPLIDAGPWEPVGDATSLALGKFQHGDQRGWVIRGHYYLLGPKAGPYLQKAHEAAARSYDVGGLHEWPPLDKELVFQE